MTERFRVIGGNNLSSFFFSGPLSIGGHSRLVLLFPLLVSQSQSFFSPFKYCRYVLPFNTLARFTLSGTATLEHCQRSFSLLQYVLFLPATSAFCPSPAQSPVPLPNSPPCFPGAVSGYQQVFGAKHGLPRHLMPLIWNRCGSSFFPS